MVFWWGSSKQGKAFLPSVGWNLVVASQLKLKWGTFILVALQKRAFCHRKQFANLYLLRQCFCINMSGANERYSTFAMETSKLYMSPN